MVLIFYDNGNKIMFYGNSFNSFKMRLIFSIIIIILFSFNIIAREIGETEITTEDGIEVFQNEKYYLLKKNVKILSDNFNLNAKDVKIDFDKNLYDITELNAKGNVNFNSSNLE